jgi:hypothetical protein
MSASLWSDPDLPLEYAFGFIDALGTFVGPLESIKKAFVTTQLAAGQDISDYNVTCHLRVSDSFSAFSSLSALVQVTELTIAPAALLSKGDKCFIISIFACTVDLFNFLPFFILFYLLKFIPVSDILNDMSDPVASAQALGIATSVVNSVTCANAGKVIYCIAV